VPRLASFHRLHPDADLWLLTSEEAPDMTTQTLDVAVRDDLDSQAQCQHRVLLQDRLYPACHPALLATPAHERLTLHGEREMDWSQWQVQGGADVGQRREGMNFSEPGQLLDAACQGLGIALVSELLSARACEQGLLQALDDARVRGPRWSWLVHEESATDPLVISFCEWLLASLPGGATSAAARA